jgi:hypothetical protein
MTDDRDPRTHGLYRPAYDLHAPEVNAITGGITRTYQEIHAGRLGFIKIGRLTRIGANDLVEYKLTYGRKPLRKSPNPKAGTNEQGGAAA